MTITHFKPNPTPVGSSLDGHATAAKPNAPIRAARGANQHAKILTNIMEQIQGREGETNPKFSQSKLKENDRALSSLLQDETSRQAEQKGKAYFSETPGSPSTGKPGPAVPADNKTDVKRSADTEDAVSPEFEAYLSIVGQVEALQHDPAELHQYFHRVAKGDFGFQHTKQLQTVLSNLMHNAFHEGHLRLGQTLSIADAFVEHRIYDAIVSSEPVIRHILDDGIPGGGPDRSHLTANGLNEIINENAGEQGYVRAMRNEALDQLAIEQVGRPVGGEMLDMGEMREARRQLMLSIAQNPYFREFVEAHFSNLPPLPVRQIA
jgi:hypothetical protein